MSPLKHTSPPDAGTKTPTVQEHARCEMGVHVSESEEDCADPDGVCGKVLRACAYELTAVFTNIFNLSLSQAIIPPMP